MKLADLGRFSVEAVPQKNGRMSVTLFVLGDEKVDGGNQRSLDTVNVTSSGKTETDATKKGIDKALAKFSSLQGKADIVRLGVLDLMGSKSDGYTCTVQVGLFDKANSGADLIRKKSLGFGSGKTADEAEDNALKSALQLMGE